MNMKQNRKLSKKKFEKKKRKNKDEIHWEGKYFCDCRVRNSRVKLGLKRYGTDN